MKVQRTVLFSLLALAICSMLFVTYASNNDSRKLGVEINVKNKPFYFPAATDRKVITGLIRVGNPENASSEDISGLKIAPKMEGDKVQVEIFAIYGDIRGVKSCDDLDGVKSKLISSKVLDKGELLNLSELAHLKTTENAETLNLKIVGFKKNFNEVYTEKISGAAQIPGCGTCGQLDCCPAPGKCIACGDCGLVCQRPPREPNPEPVPGPDTE